MILVALTAAVALCALGTRAATIAFGAAAVAAVLDGGPFAPPAAMAALTGGGLLLVGTDPRRLALPTVGVAAALLAAAAPNAAVVAPAWTVAGAAAVLQAARPGDAAERPWALWLLIGDLIVVAAVATTVAVDGFSSWPPGPQLAVFVPLLLAALLRVPLAAGALDRSPESGLVLVRAEVGILLVLALRRGPVDPAWLAFMMASGGMLFALGGTLRRVAARDAIQEAGLLVVAVAAAGDGATGWMWAALAAGTLVHLVRVADPRGTPAARFLAGIVRGSALGSPFVPVAFMLGGAAVVREGLAGSIVVLGLIGGLGLRADRAAPDRRRASGGFRHARVAAAGLAASAGFLGPALAGPLSGGRTSPSWLPAWAVVLLLAGGLAGYVLYDHSVPARIRRAPETLRLDWMRPPADQRALAAVAAVRGALVAPLLALAATAAGLWLVGLWRGFL